MKRIFEFITKANQILLFLAALGAIIGISILIYDSMGDGHPPQVRVAQNPSETKTVVVEDVHYLGLSNDIYMFGIVRREVAASGDRQKSMQAIQSRWSYSQGSDDGQIVNVSFSKDGKKIRSLLPFDGFVYRYETSPEIGGGNNRSVAHFFRCVTEDTNGDRVLNADDRVDLYIVAKDLSRPDIVIRGIIGFHVLSPTHVLVKSRDQGRIRFVDVDVVSSNETEVVWE